MALAGRFEVVRDPLWNNIRIDAPALRVVDSAPFQRLRYIRQLGHAFLVYPGATHTRFEHALGTYHLARRALGLLAERGELDGVPDDEAVLVRFAALLHDIGHYPYSHALEEAGLPSHEAVAAGHFEDAELGAAVSAIGIPSATDRITALIRGVSRSPLQRLISGSLDLDKIEYLTRDARMCGVPYGTVDVDRLLHSLALTHTAGDAPCVGVHEKGVSALESLLFAKYQMYRNVYWHHAVRSATAMFKRLVRAAIAGGALDAAWIAGGTDESLMEAIRRFSGGGLAERLEHRRLYKRALDLRAARVPPGAGAWMAQQPDLLQRVEDRLAAELGVEPGSVLLDYPAKPAMLAVDLPLVLRTGRTAMLRDGEDAAGLVGIQQIADELHTNARRLRVFVARDIPVAESAVLALAERGAAEVEADLAAGRELLRTDR